MLCINETLPVFANACVQLQLAHKIAILQAGAALQLGSHKYQLSKSIDQQTRLLQLWISIWSVVCRQGGAGGLHSHVPPVSLPVLDLRPL